MQNSVVLYVHMHVHWSEETILSADSGETNLIENTTTVLTEPIVAIKSSCLF